MSFALISRKTVVAGIVTCTLLAAGLQAGIASANTVRESGATLTMRDRLAVPSDDCRRPVAKLRVKVRPGSNITLDSTKVRRVVNGKVKYDGPYVGFNDANEDGVIRHRIGFRVCAEDWPTGRYRLAVRVDPSGRKDTFVIANGFHVVPGEAPVG